jgi:hypothetical protein
MTSIGSSLLTSVTGLQKQADRVAKDSKAITDGFAAAQNAASNAQAADSVSVSDRAAVVPAVEDAVRGAVLPAEGEVTAALVDLLQAATAYKANAAAFRVTADVQADVINTIGKRSS